VKGHPTFNCPRCKYIYCSSKLHVIHKTGWVRSRAQCPQTWVLGREAQLEGADDPDFIRDLVGAKNTYLLTTDTSAQEAGDHNRSHQHVGIPTAFLSRMWNTPTGLIHFGNRQFRRIRLGFGAGLTDDTTTVWHGKSSPPYSSMRLPRRKREALYSTAHGVTTTPVLKPEFDLRLRKGSKALGRFC